MISYSDTRVLVVEDNVIQAAVIAKAVRSAGFIVDVACNQYEAVTAARTQLPQVVLIDVIIGRNQNGIEILEQMRKYDKGNKMVVALYTAMELDAVDEYAKSVGIVATLHKPMHPMELVGAVKVLAQLYKPT